MKAKYIIAILLTGGLIASGYLLYQYFTKQQKLLEDYGIELLKVKFGSLSEDMAVINVTLRITNKSVVEATVEKVYADIYLNGAYMCNVVNDGQFIIPAKGSSDVSLKFTCANKEILKTIVNTALTLFTTGDIPYRVNGSVKIKGGGLVSISKSFDYTGGIKSDMLG